MEQGDLKRNVFISYQRQYEDLPMWFADQLEHYHCV